MNRVIFKSSSRGIGIDFKKIDDFDETLVEFKDKLDNLIPILPKKTNIYLSGLTLSDDMFNQVFDIVEESGLSVVYIGNDIYVERSKAKIKDEPKKTNETKEIKELDTFLATQNETLYHTGSLRNGQSLKFDGSIVLVGDVNAGAEVVATGNIIVIGKVRGLIHAGFKGDNSCFITATYLAPVQLRIGNVIAAITEEMKEKGKKGPCTAYLNDGELLINYLFDK